MTQVKLSIRELELVRNHDLCRIATITADGWPHCVPVGYIYRTGKFYIPVSKRSKKTRNLKANPRASIVIEDEKERVLMIQGKVEVIEDERFSELRRWMSLETGWTIGEESS